MNTDPNPSSCSCWKLLKPLAIALSIFAIAQLSIFSFPGLANRLRWFRLSGVVVGSALAAWSLLKQVGTIRLVTAALAGALAAGTWFSVEQDGFTGDGEPDYFWRFASDYTAGTLQRPEVTEIVHVNSLSADMHPDNPQNAFGEERWDYPGFLGRDRNAQPVATAVSTDWQENEPQVRWRTPVGSGWSSFALVDHFAVTQEQLESGEAVTCRDLYTGELLWTVVSEGVHYSDVYGGDGPRATPTVSNGFVFALGATGKLHCIRMATGEQIWERDILADADAKNLQWGMAGSPLVFEDLVVVCPGGKDDHSVVAYDRKTGDVVWHAGNGRAAYSSPMLVEFAGKRQVVLLNGPGLEAYEANTGEPLWNYPWTVNGRMMTSVTQPIALPGDDGTSSQFFISGGYGKGCVLVSVASANGEFEVQEVWKPNLSLKAKFNNVVAKDGFVYGMDDKVLTCVDLSTGKRKWKKGRYGYGQLMLVSDTILVQAESGDVALVSANPNGYHELSRISPLTRKTWNPPALRGNLLVVRNDTEAVCLELAVED